MAESNKPSHEIFVVEGEGDDAYFTKVGAAWPNKKGTGFNIKLSALPLNGRLTMTEAREADTKAKAA
jgi:hypothetical protein